MQIATLLLMRHEILLTIFVIIALFFEVFVERRDKNRFVPVLISLFLIITVVGFLPQEEGTLFGGMFVLSEMQILMKNVLNIGVLIVLLQSVQWLKKEENKNNVLEFIILLISTLIGMNFMISSGDFLMFYIGLELATIPIAALAAFDRKFSIRI